MNRRVVHGVLSLVLAGGLAGACANPRNGLGTGTTVCFKAIPPAVEAVHHEGRLVGVREVSNPGLARRHPVFTRLGTEKLCLLAFQGTYRAGDLPGAKPPAPGQFAVVAVDPASAKVAGVFVFKRLPLRFRHSV